MDSQKLEIIKLLHDEWKYRLSQLWSLIIKCTTFTFILIFIPLIYEKIGVDFTQTKIPLSLFPISGIALAIIVCVFSTIEMRKVNKIKKGIKTTINEETCFDVHTKKSNPLSQNLPIIIFICQSLIASAILYYIY